MAVPNTNTFSQRDVVNEIYGDNSNRSLTDLFSAATGTFDPNYVGSKNSLLNFRNYQHKPSNTITVFTGWWSNRDAINVRAYSQYNVTSTIEISGSILLLPSNEVIYFNEAITIGNNNGLIDTVYATPFYEDVIVSIYNITPNEDVNYRYIF